jgi:uncharacterized protein
MESKRSPFIQQYLVLSLAALLIGVSKAGFGGGTGILVMPVLALMIDPRESLGLMLPLLLACDIISLYFFWGQWDLRNLVLLSCGAVVGIVAGSFALDAISTEALSRSIGGIAIAFALIQVARNWLPKGSEPWRPPAWFGVLVGFGTGFVSTLAHVGGVLTTMFLLAQRLDSRRFVATTTAVYFLINAGKVLPYLYLGTLTEEMLLFDLPLLPVVLAGTVLGVLFNRRVPGQWFSRIVLVFVLITGIQLLFN